MPVNVITPQGAAVEANGNTRTIHFPALNLWEPVDQKVARAKGVDRIAPSDFEERIERLMRGETVDLTTPGRMRFGATFALVVNGRPALGKFDGGHPLQAHKLTPASGAYDQSDRTFTGAYQRENAEEFLVGPPGAVGVWQHAGFDPVIGHAQAYAKHHGMPFDLSAVATIVPTISDLHWTIYFGEERIQALIAWEPETSDIEVIVTGEATLPEGWWLADGEQIPHNGGVAWRKQPIVTGYYDKYPQTTKAQVFLKAFETGLRPF